MTHNPRGYYLERVGNFSQSKILHINAEKSIVGRDENCDIRIPIKSRTVSRVHCQLTLENGKLFIENLSQSTSTFLNEDKVLQKTLVDVGDQIGLGTNPTVNSHEIGHERFIYKLCEPEIIPLLSSDDETIIEEEEEENNNNNNNGAVRPVIVVLSDERIFPTQDAAQNDFESPAFSESEASSQAGHRTKDLINDIVSGSLETNDEHPQTKDCSVVIKKLSKREINQFKSQVKKAEFNAQTSPPSLDFPLLDKDSSTSSSASLSSHKSKTLEVVDCKTSKKPKRSLSFSRTKYDAEKRTKNIKRRLSKFVDNEDSDHGSEKSKNHAGRHTTTNSDIDKNKSPQESDKKTSKESVEESRTKKNGANSEKSSGALELGKKNQKSRSSKDHKDTDKRRKSLDHRNSKGSHEKNRRKTIYTDKPSETKLPLRIQSFKDDTKNNHQEESNDKSPQPISTKQTEKPTTSSSTLRQENADNEVSNSEKNTRKRSRENDCIEEGRLPKATKYCEASKSPRPSTSTAKENLDFPSLDNRSPRNSPVRGVVNKINQRHQSMFHERINRVSQNRRPSSGEIPNIEQKLIQTSKDIRKRFKSVGERPPQIKPLVLNEDRKQKLKELTMHKQPEVTTPKDNSSNPFEQKLHKTGTVKVKITTANRGDFLTQELPTKSKNAKAVTNKDESTLPKKSAAESFRERHVKNAAPTANGTPKQQLSEDSDDFLNMIKVPTPPLDFYNRPTSSALSIPIKDLQINETCRSSSPIIASSIPTTSTATLAPFPNVPLLNGTIETPELFERETESKKGLKSILKKADFPCSRFKRVSFPLNDELVKVRLIEHDRDERRGPRMLSLSNVGPRKSLKDIETSIWEEVLRWDTEWLKLDTPPEHWQNKTMKTSYSSLQEYKSILKNLLRIEVLSKLKSSNNRPSTGEREYHMMLITSKQPIGNRIRLTLSCQNDDKSFSQGMLMIVRVKSLNEIDYFGNICELKTNDTGMIVTVEIINRDLPHNLSVVKCKPLMYIWNEIKSMVALENIQEKPIVERFLKPEVNSLQSSLNDTQFETVLVNDQNEIVNIITSECISNRKIANIIALNSKAGTGKTKVLIESLISIVHDSKLDSGAKFSILVCANSNGFVDTIASETAKLGEMKRMQSKSKNFSKIKLARIGNRDKISKEVQSMHVSHYETLKDYDVIFTTVTNSYELYPYKRDFDVCFIDDANCCIDSELAIIMQLNITKLILIGDLKQTQPMAHSHHLVDSKFDETFFSRMVKTFEGQRNEENPILELASQHRMNKDLTEIANRFIYENNSISQSTDTQQSPNKLGLYSFFVLGYSGKFTNLAPYAQNDIFILSSFCEKLIGQIKNANIGIIVRAYQVQMEMTQLLSSNKVSKVEVFSVDRLRDIEVEKDIIIIACAERADVQYFSGLNRFCKAFTRARHSVFIVGRFTYFVEDIPNCSVWNNMIKYAKTNNMYAERNVNDDIVIVRNTVEYRVQNAIDNW